MAEGEIVLSVNQEAAVAKGGSAISSTEQAAIASGGVAVSTNGQKVAAQGGVAISYSTADPGLKGLSLNNIKADIEAAKKHLFEKTVKDIVEAKQQVKIVTNSIAGSIKNKE